MPQHYPPHAPASPANTRPQRRTLCGEDGRRLSLATGAEAFVCLNTAREENSRSPALVLGLGAESGNALAGGPLCDCTDVLWLECPAFAQGMEAQCAAWTQGVPPGWHSLNVEEDGDWNHGALPRDLAASVVHAAKGRRVYWHTQNLRLFPSFWGPILGAVRAALLGVPSIQSTPRLDAGFWTQGQPRTVLLPGGETDLLHRELAQAFTAEGFSLCALDADKLHDHTPTRRPPLHNALRAHLKADRPALFFSVNGRGLDTQGVDFALLRACGVPVALWLVDNPWHILSGWRQGWWREAHLFVTDHSFMADLRKAGAVHVHHLPLAVAQHMAEHRPATADGPVRPAATDTLVHFVGRASFPARDKFFAAARVPDALMEEARPLLEAAPLPDFHWWTRKLGVSLWPGYEVRTAGLGAERCAAVRRARWLASALPVGLTVHGDAQGWRVQLPSAPPDIFLPAVDYYGALPDVYARARYSLNVTSLLLPAGLTQRHFDVWAAGGFLLSDTTAGLDIFPPELTHEIALAGPPCLPDAVNRLERAPLLRRHLQEAWRGHLNTAHTYAHRVRCVLEIVKLGG